VEAFWKLYPAHYSQDGRPVDSVQKYLDELRIGTLDPKDIIQVGPADFVLPLLPT